MTVERYWNDKLCRSLKSPNLTGGPVARLSDSGHLGRNDSGMTIGTTFEQKLKNWRLRRLNQFLWYACLENYIKPNSLTQSSWSIWHIPTYCQDLKFLNGLKALKNPKSKTRHFFLFCQSIWFQLWNHEKKVPKAFNFGAKTGQIYIKRARSRCKKS